MVRFWGDGTIQKIIHPITQEEGFSDKNFLKCNLDDSYTWNKYTYIELNITEYKNVSFENIKYRISNN